MRRRANVPMPRRRHEPGSVRPVCERMFVPRYTESDAREAIGSSLSYAEALRKLGLRPTGGNHQLFRRYVDQVWQIPTDHFDPVHAQRYLRRTTIKLDDVLVEHSTYSRSSLK